MDYENNHELSMSWYNFYLFVNGAVMLISLFILPGLDYSDRRWFEDVFPIMNPWYYFPFIIGLIQLPMIIGLFKKREFGFKINKLVLFMVCAFYLANFLASFDSYNNGAVPIAISQLLVALIYVYFSFKYFEKRKHLFIK